MFRTFIIFVIIISIIIGAPAYAVSTTTVDATSSGSLTYSHCISMETANGGLQWPTFGHNQTSYTYDGSQASVLTMGRSTLERQVNIDQTDSNYMAGMTTVTGDYMINAEDTAGMINIQPNIPEDSCDREGFLNGSGTTTGSYPYSENFEGKTGVILHAGGAYQSEVGLNDANVHLSGAADIPEKGYLYQSKIINSMKGFDKNSTGLNLDTSESMNIIARTAIKSDETEVHAKVVSEYTSIGTAFDDVIEAEAVNQFTTTISEERIDDELPNSTIEVNETANLTPTNSTYGEAPSLEELANQSIMRE